MKKPGKEIMRKTAIVALLLTFCSVNAFAEEKKVTTKSRKDVSVTIYNENLALVKDSRKVMFDRGINNLAFENVSAHIQPETALLSGKGVSVLEQNFNFDLLTPQKMLEKAVGSMVRVIETNPATGEKTVSDAEVLSVANGVVLKIGDRIETSAPGRIVFSEVPDKLRDKPTLVLMLNSDSNEAKNIELSYLTSGLKWKADYVAELSADEKTMNLNGLVTLTNKSGVEYEDAQLQLVAGNLNRVRNEIEQIHRMRSVKAMAFDAAAPSMREESLMDYHLYTMGRRTTIESNQTKQVALLSGSDITVQKIYELKNPVNIYNGGSSDFSSRNAKVWLKFENEKNMGLGLPLPAGVVRVYKADSAGKLLFVGEDRIKHTPNKEKVKLKLGEAFDVTVKGKRTEYNRLGKKLYESAYEVTLKNAKKENAEVTLTQSMPNQWQMLGESLPHKKKSSNTVEWKVTVPPEGEKILVFKIRVRH